MLIEADAKGLEVVVAFWLANDKVGREEILNGTDIHGENQARFGLPRGPDGRLIAKKFIFRLLYGGQAFTYARDPEFTGVSDSTRFWQKIIDEFYEKYRGVHDWHQRLLREVDKTGRLVMPTGRVFDGFKRNRQGDLPRTEILNYPVQGTAADIMSVGRVLLFSKCLHLADPEIKHVSTVHDSLLLDVPEGKVERCLPLIKQSFLEIPLNFNSRFGSNLNFKPLDLPLGVEIKVGPDWGNMKKVA